MKVNFFLFSKCCLFSFVWFVFVCLFACLSFGFCSFSFASKNIRFWFLFLFLACFGYRLFFRKPTTKIRKK